MCSLNVDAGAKSQTSTLLNFLFMKNEDRSLLGVVTKVDKEGFKK